MENNLHITHDGKSGHHLLKNHSVLLHCNHFNIELQNTILLPEYIPGFDIQFNAAAETAFSLLAGFFPEGSPREAARVLETAGNIYHTMGLGLLDLSTLTADGGTIESTHSHYHLGWQIRFNKSESMAHVFTQGYIAGVLSFIYNKPFTVDVHLKNSIFQFTATPVDEAEYFQNLDQGAEDINITTPPNPVYDTGLPCRDITREMLKSLPHSAPNGLIEAFGVYLTYLPAEYYGKIAFRFEQALDETGGFQGLARPLLVESGHVCGFNTFGGIMTSDIWKTLVQPLLNSREDWVYGIVSIINALGWGHWHINELKPGERLVLHVYNSTEALSYRRYFGVAHAPKCYTAEGAAAAIMNLIYKGDITEEPILDKAYYNEVFRSHSAFHSRETKCVAKGDPYCEFEFTNK